MATESVLEESESQVENQNGAMMVETDQHGQDPVAPENTTEGRSNPTLNTPPPAPDHNAGVELEAVPNNAPNEDTKSACNRAPTTKEALYAHTGDLSYFVHGWWSVSILEDEDIVREIKTYLETIGKFAGAEAVVELLSQPETQAQLGIPKAISLCTAQRWMQCCGGFCWRKTPKGQYLDGHERADVVDYRQKVFLPFWKGEPDTTRPMILQPGEKPVLIWFHDELIFFANDRRLIRWVGNNEQATPFKKGEGSTILVANFVSESARVIFRPGVNWDGYFTCNQVVEELKNAIKIVEESYPEYTHVFIYDNAPSHTKRPDDAITARQMPKKAVPEFPRPVVKKVPFMSIRKFAAQTQRFVDAYVANKRGPEAIEWATKTFRSHRQTPTHLAFSQI
ncbi:hypothetical protein B0J17DRAFT_708936 [Rhizoctonia solani]|nr:hypothetical protein B0J17DRAFT_708936 [Rhizoctonia solani]